jgi:aspartyl-tRNA(Asn)/glutamyl-tRNA(Gln) amidotransferase subunit B
MVESGDLSATAAKTVLDGVLAGEGNPRAVAEAKDLIQLRDEEALAAAVAEVVAAHPDEVARIAAGDGKLIGFLVGQVMAATGGKADPRRVSELIREHASA